MQEMIRKTYQEAESKNHSLILRFQELEEIYKAEKREDERIKKMLQEGREN